MRSVAHASKRATRATPVHRLSVARISLKILVHCPTVLQLIGKSNFITRPKLVDYTTTREELLWRSGEVINIK